jgi:serine/threonine protein kinase
MDDTRRGGPRDDEAVHEVMAACIDAWHAGGAAAAEAVLAAHPDVAPLLRERLEKLQRAGMLGDAEPDTASLPPILGEFRLGRRLGGGGMGVVHLAEQMSLERIVAIKLVRPELRFFPGARARFRREVEAVARLGDAGIVPIHCVGEDQGIDFFAMEYVRGCSLGDVIAAVRERPPAGLQGRDVAVVAAARGEQQLPDTLPELFAGSWVSTCCRIVARMARAAHHAHERGVVHRDLKPSNAMVTADGRVLLLDFGLAAAAGTSRITRSGAVLGTPHYMAPEQLQDGDVDARTDVYALGVTLHELLALRPPFHAESEHVLRQQILHGDAAPLRAANAEVPRDVATIVGVARDRDPARRYATAQALADDLERFLQHRPILARPVGPVVRTVRWLQRHPAATAAAAVLLLAAAALPFAMRWSRDEAEHRVEAAQQRARANLQNALDAVGNMLRQERAAAMRQKPGLDEARRRQIEDATGLMARLHRENPDDRAVAAMFVRGMIRVAELRRLFGDHPGALAVLDECEPVLRGLTAGSPADGLSTEAVALALNRGSSLVEQGRVADAAAVWRGIVARYERRDAATLPRDVVSGLASCHNNLALVTRQAGDVDAALRHLETSVALEAHVALANDTVDHRLDRCRTRLNLGTAQRDKGDVAAALVTYREVADALQQLAAANPDEPEVQRELVRSQAAQAAAASDARDFRTSRPLRDQAIAAMERLVAAYAERAAYRQELGLLLLDAARDAQLDQDLDAAAALSARAVDSHRELLRRSPDNAEVGSQTATMLRQRSGVAFAQQRREQALADLDEAIALQQRVLQLRPDEPWGHIEAAALQQELAIYHWRAEQWPPARDALRAARDHYEQALARGVAQAREPQRLPKLLTVLARAELMCDDFDAVVVCLRRHQELNPLRAAELRELGANLHVDDRADFQALVRAADDRQKAAR